MSIPDRLIPVGVLLCALAKFAMAQGGVDATLRIVDSLYEAGSYAQAELEARRMLENELLSDSVHVAAQQWVAFALVAQDKPSLAKEHFLMILRQRPSHELDPILTSPKILAVFNDARATFLATRRHAIDSSASSPVVSGGRITFRTVVFPGWEQWYHGRTTVGPLLVGAGAVTLGTGIAMAIMRRAARQDYLEATAPQDIAAKYNTYDNYAKAEAYSFAAFAAVYVISVIDVFAHDSAITLSPASTGSMTAGRGLTLSYSLP